jgi:hypothetical protein
MTATIEEIHESKEIEGEKRDICDLEVEDARRERQREIDEIPYT